MGERERDLRRPRYNPLVVPVDADFSLMTEPIGKFDFPYAKMPKTGYIGMQNHGGEVCFKNIQIKKF